MRTMVHLLEFPLSDAQGWLKFTPQFKLLAVKLREWKHHLVRDIKRKQKNNQQLNNQQFHTCIWKLQISSQEFALQVCSRQAAWTFSCSQFLHEQSEGMSW